MSAPGSMSIRTGYLLTNPRVTKSLLSDGLNDSSSDSDLMLVLMMVTLVPSLVGIFDKGLGIRFSSVVPGS